MKYMHSVLIAALLLSLTMAGCEGQQKSVTLSKEQAKQSLMKLIEDVEVVNVTKGPINGLWEVHIKSGGRHGLAYLDAKGEYAFIGSIVETATLKNITEARFLDITKIDPSTIPLEHALIMGQEKEGNKKVYVFVDPECPYCELFHEEMSEVLRQRQDVTFYLLVSPVITLHPEAYATAKAILCEKDNAKALELLMKSYKREPIGEPSCESDAVDVNIKAMNDLEIQGTPTLVLQDGRVLAGAQSASAMIKALDE